jgi:hypothetical protein
VDLSASPAHGKSLARRGVRAAIVVVILLVVQPAAAEQPHANWRTIETPHFRVHFPAGFEPWARRAAAAIENIHAEVVRHAGFTPTTRVDVIVEDPQAAANGLAIPVVDRPVIILWTSPPASDSPIGSFVDWPQLLLTHEFAHIAHLTRSDSRVWTILRYVTPLPVGPLSVSPRWVKEGYATVVEGAVTGSGRPSSSLRAMVLRRLAVEGKLPEYRQLNATRGWLAAGMAYLAGSAFFEWLERRAGAGTLQQVWTRMASQNLPSFTSAFRAVYGKSPRDMYDRFKAEVTAAAIAEEKRLENAGLVHGELWHHVDSGVSAPQVNRSGAQLLARVEPNRGDAYIAIWDLADTSEHLKPRSRLRAINGSAPAHPRWMPDDERVLYSRRSPDRDGVLHWDLSLWHPKTGAVRKVTHGADVLMADPLPDGRRAVAVRSQYGRSELVLVNLESGTVTPVVPPGEDIIWNYPRVSPDGTTILALVHRGAGWRLVRLSSDGTDLRELDVAGMPIGPPAWSADSSQIYFTSDASGIWNIYMLDGADATSARAITRVTGGAAAPAPAGRSIFFLELTAKGIDIRRMDDAQPVTPLARPADDAAPILPPVTTKPVRLPSDTVSAPRSYRAWSTLTVRPIYGSTSGPDIGTRQIGVQATDVIGRLNWQSLFSLAREEAGNGRDSDRAFEGAATALAYRGLPIALVAEAFVARERIGRQTLVSRPDLDRRRFGIAASGLWRRVLSSGALAVDGGIGASAVESLSDAKQFGRVLAFTSVLANWRRTRGTSGIDAGFRSHGVLGRTDNGNWRQALVHGEVGAQAAVGRVAVSARYGDTAGAATRFDLFAIGGAPSAIVPRALDLNRVYEFGLPPFLQVGRRTAAFRAEYVAPRVPVTVYLVRLGGWNPDLPRPPFAQAAGVELRFAEVGARSTLHMPGTVSFYIGRAAIRSDAPRIRATRTYVGLVYRP